jgi:hypothetical protein
MAANGALDDARRGLRVDLCDAPAFPPYPPTQPSFQASTTCRMVSDVDPVSHILSTSQIHLYRSQNHNPSEGGLGLRTEGRTEEPRPQARQKMWLQPVSMGRRPPSGS